MKLPWDRDVTPMLARAAGMRECTRTYTRDVPHRERTTLAFAGCDVAAEVGRDDEVRGQQGARLERPRGEGPEPRDDSSLLAERPGVCARVAPVRIRRREAAPRAIS